MYRYFPHILLGLYLVWFGVLAVDPYNREIWFSENLPIVLIVTLLVVTYPKFRFSNTAYFLMSMLIFLHTLGGHYTFERVPFGWVTDFFGFERNHFDRVAHFSVGFYAFAIVEFLCRQALVTRRWVAYLFGFFAICDVSCATLSSINFLSCSFFRFKFLIFFLKNFILFFGFFWII